MGWGDDLLHFADELGEKVVDIPSKIYHEYADAKPQAHSYQGNPGRHHDSETVVPNGSADYSDNERAVFLACRVVGGGALGETLGLLTNVLRDTLIRGPDLAPNPAFHWCIVVGDYLHQLQATSLIGGWNYYTNARINLLTGGWRYFPVGCTTFNDIVIRDVATSVMNGMPEVYHAQNNNCQMFSLRLVDKILKTARTQKFLMANFTYGRQKAPTADTKLLSENIVTRIDTAEVEEPTQNQPAPVAAEKRLSTEESFVVEEPLIVGDAQSSRSDILCEIAKIMVDNTPTLTEKDVEIAGEDLVVLAPQVTSS